MEKEINVEEIMEEIRENIKKRGYDKEPLSFEEIPVPQIQNNEEFSFREFMVNLESLNLNWNNDSQVPVTGGNPIVNLVKKVIMICTGFIVVPIVRFQNEYNASNVRCMNQMKRYVEDTERYKQRIVQLETEMEELKRVIQSGRDRRN